MEEDRRAGAVRGCWREGGGDEGAEEEGGLLVSLCIGAIRLVCFLVSVGVVESSSDSTIIVRGRVTLSEILEAFIGKLSDA